MKSSLVPVPDRRARKRLDTRKRISTAATRLFTQRGFDRVTVDEIAVAADVGRMTVFNHFPRKEDMFFDREDEARELLRGALMARDRRVAPIEALRLLAHRLAAEDSPLVRFTAASRGFIETIERSDALTSRARAIRDELAQVIALALTESTGQDPSDPSAHLAGALVLAGWSVALIEAHHTFRARGDAAISKLVFLGLVDQGALALSAAMSGTPYA